MTPTERVRHLERAFEAVIDTLKSQVEVAAIMGRESEAKLSASIVTYMREILAIGADA